MVGEGVPPVILMIFLFFTLSLGPLEAEIQVFSGGLSENDRKSINERVHAISAQTLKYQHKLVSSFEYARRVPRAYILTYFLTKTDTRNTPKIKMILTGIPRNGNSRPSLRHTCVH